MLEGLLAMAETPEQKSPVVSAPTESSTRLTDEDVARLAAEGLRLRRELEERVNRQTSSNSPATHIRFR